jgi:hypothetical protein
VARTAPEPRRLGRGRLEAHEGPVLVCDSVYWALDGGERERSPENSGCSDRGPSENACLGRLETDCENRAEPCEDSPGYARDNGSQDDAERRIPNDVIARESAIRCGGKNVENRS